MKNPPPTVESHHWNNGSGAAKLDFLSYTSHNRRHWEAAPNHHPCLLGWSKNSNPRLDSPPPLPYADKNTGNDKCNYNQAVVLAQEAHLHPMKKTSHPKYDCCHYSPNSPTTPNWRCCQKSPRINYFRSLRCSMRILKIYCSGRIPNFRSTVTIPNWHCWMIRCFPP